MPLFERIRGWLKSRRPVATQGVRASRQPITHVILLDGTNSSLDPGCETHIGTIYKMLCATPAQARLSLYYEAGIQWLDWRHTHKIALGRGLNRQIRRAYGYLASRYRPGDRIFLLGYSRGAFAVRSLAGVIDRVGLLQGEHATVRNVRQAYRHYECAPDGAAAQAFRARFCHDQTRIEAVGVFDTVKALGLRLPLLWMLSERRHAFHNHALSDVVRHGFHALALDENRVVFAPELWEAPQDWSGKVEQVWFRGSHGDIGGQIGGDEAARPLANIALVWMMDRLEGCGLPLPEGWRYRLPCDVHAPSIGTLRGWGKLFLYRRRRVVGQDRSEALHPSARAHWSGPELPLAEGDDGMGGLAERGA